MPLEANPQFLTPFTQVARRSVSAGGADITNGRWVSVAAGVANPTPAAGARAFLVVEGTIGAKESATYAGNDGVPSATFENTSAKAADQVAIAYGVYRAQVGPQGVAAASIAEDDLLAVNALGQLVVATITGGTSTGFDVADVSVAVAESDYVAGTSTTLTFRTLAV